ncbi:Sas10 carboxy-terminal domain protein (macronuclear) [Tetrahymena thermophila SB210]|uniref:Sas10 carboxy-terminal domain protein n=1 Tax=Tetrahymena thermophila (strain SB210) TaxID=312017 RepID=I7M2B6_TETTS|nr:Sas10 carboxy-terminal domain protein [Tetrahymena thermophila SB210]EAR99694.3 Sas10 carboxy-terminal domain protein [Tetrahymena thermophila SB210]|eukprot:XP_001019939.3 Sas10 carboxy-terminal domain protein [Tetrahymena thermophila SB210]
MGKKIANGNKYDSESEEDFDDDGSEPQLDDEMEEEDSQEEYQSNSDILDDDNDSEGSEVQVNRGADFGKQKQNYYKDSDVTDSEDSGEEEGADAVYREQQNDLTEADFIDDDFAKQDSIQQSEDEDAAHLDADKAKDQNEEKKQKLIKKLSPEIISLAQEMNISISEVTDKLFPIMDVEEAKKILPGKGQNFLEIRYEILISYTMCILFYLLLKSKGKITNNHPVLDKLTKYKTMIERMNISLDDFETQVGKIIAKNLSSKKKGSQKGQKAMTFEEKMKLNQKNQNKNSKETEQQRLARELQEELKKMYGESGEDDDEFDDFDQDEESENSLLSDDEEDIRISKGVQASKKQVKQAAPSKKKDDGEINMDSVEPWMLDDEEDGDMLLKEPKKVDLNKIKKKEANKKVQNSEEFEDDFYKQAKQQQIDEQISRKQQKIQEKEKKKEELAKKYEIREVNEDESRKISTQILQNKGNLIRKRKAKSGNARVHYREKFTKKQKIHERNHRGKIYDKQVNGYMGEMGAIKPSLIKSNKLA